MGPFLLVWSYLTGMIIFWQLLMFFVFLFVGLYFSGRFPPRQLFVAFILVVVPVSIGLYVTGRFPSWELFESPYVAKPGEPSKPVAFLPWFDGNLPLDLFLWYLICSLLFGTLLSRVFGVGMGMGMEETE